MNYREWLLVLIVCSAGTSLANWLTSGTNPIESLPGLVLLAAVSLLAVACTRLLPFKIPVIAYCAVLGMLIAAPFSPLREFATSSTGVIELTAPFTIVGAFAGIAISNQLKTFVRQGWKYAVVGVAVMTGTFIGSLLWDTLTLKLSGAI